MIRLTKKSRSILEEIERENAETFFHSVRVKSLVYSVIKESKYLNYNEEEITEILTGALLHDIGKYRIRNRIITKKTKLSDKEFEEIKRHTEYGIDELCGEFTGKEKEIILNIVKYHHERIDGSGYNKMKDLPGYVEIVAICDVYDALTNDRVYRPKFSPEEAMNMIVEGKCGKFSEKVIDSLKRAVNM